MFDYQEEDSFGKVISVDTVTVIIEVTDEERLKTLQVNRLTVLRSSKLGQHLLGLISQVTRKKILDVNAEVDGSFVEQNLCKISLIGTLLDRVGDAQNVFRRTLDSVPEIDASCFALEGAKLTEFMQVISQSTNAANSLCLGKYTLDDNAAAYLNGNKFFQKHAFIGGSTGAGKSWTVAKIVEQIALLKNANAVVFDIHGEYQPLIGNGISHYKIAGPSEVNEKKKLSDGVLYLPYWLLTYEGLVSFLVDRSDQSAVNQSMIVAREVNKAKKQFLSERKEDDLLENYTVDSPIPFDLEKFMTVLVGIDTEKVPGANGKPKNGDFFGKLSRMISRMESKISDRRLGFLFQGDGNTKELGWLNELVQSLMGGSAENEAGGVKIIDFSEVPSDVLPLIVSLIARLVFSVQQWTKNGQRHPIALICDEAHLYLPNRNSGGSVDEISLQIFERIAKEGRKYGVSLVVVSQRPSELSKTILSQCSNFVAMRLTNSEDQNVIKKLLPDSLGNFADILPTLDTGEALVVGDASLLPTRVRIDEPINKPNSGTVDFWTDWQIETDVKRLGSAVENWRNQSIQ